MFGSLNYLRQDFYCLSQVWQWKLTVFYWRLPLVWTCRLATHYCSPSASPVKTLTHSLTRLGFTWGEGSEQDLKFSTLDCFLFWAALCVRTDTVVDDNTFSFICDKKRGPRRHVHAVTVTVDSVCFAALSQYLHTITDDEHESKHPSDTSCRHSYTAVQVWCMCVTSCYNAKGIVLSQPAKLKFEDNHYRPALRCKCIELLS